MFVIHEGDPLSQRFDLSGRLFGGFWQGLKRARRAGIRIDGEPVATIDYSSMFARLAYASKGVRPRKETCTRSPDSKATATPSSWASAPCCSISMRDGSGRRPEEPDQRLPRGWTLG